MSADNYPLVSIIVPCYNHEKFVKGTLDSILADAYPNKELIIINDGSKDSSHELILEWTESHKSEIPITYRNRTNRGVCATLNELIKLSKGDYILPIASDDQLISNTIAERVNILEQNRDRNKLVVVADSLVIDMDGTLTHDSSIEQYNRGKKSQYCSDSGILEESIINPGISGPSVMIHRSIFDLIGMYPENLRAEDWFFYQRAACINAIIFIDKKVGRYRVHGSNNSGKNMSRQLRLKIYKSIILTYYMNLPWFPTIRFKMLGLRELLKYVLLVLKWKYLKND